MSLLLFVCAPLLMACQDQGPGFLSGGAPVPPEMSKPQFRGYADQDAESYVISMTLLSSGGFEGKVAYRFRATAPLEHIFLDRNAVSTWKTSFFTLGGEPIHVVEGDYSVMVPVGKTLQIGETFEFAATFSGTAAPGLYRERNQHGDTYVFSDNFPASARGWLPCEDSNSDRASFELTLTIPPGWDAIGSGDWHEQAKPAGSDFRGRKFVGKTSSDIPPGLFAFTAGPYLRFPETGDPRLVDHFIFPQDRDKAEGALEFHAEWMEIMERTFGPYQYAKFTTIQVPTKWGGMEYPGNVWLSKRIFDYAGSGVSTMAHEFAHMWFGDAIGYAQWEDSWLSEGFASYFGPWLHEQAGGGGALLEDLKGSRTRWRQASRARKLPILWKDYSKPRDFFGRAAANTYQKGAWVLHMLRQEVGDEAFFGGIATFYKAHAGQAVVSADFIAAMESASAKDLGWFFEQWLERPGAPRLELEDQQGTLVVRQTQAGAPYRFKLRIAWLDKNGKAVEKVFAIDSAETSLDIGSGSRDWKVDPQFELLFVE
jgi:aminopeptidase N